MLIRYSEKNLSLCFDDSKVRVTCPSAGIRWLNADTLFRIKG